MNPPSPRTPSIGPLRVVQIGCGAWGQNVLRELASHPCASPVLVVDPRAAARDRAAVIAPGATTADSLHALDDVEVDAAIVVTPGPLHAQHARSAIERGLHVFVEKPLATSSADAAMLCALAEGRGVVGMVGHLLHHHPAAAAMIELVRSGRLGAPLRVRSDRCSIAGTRDVDGSVLWSLAPHDLSMIRAIDPSPTVLTRVDVLRSSVAGEPLEAELCLKTARGLIARVNVSRVADRKMRRMQIDCERGSIMFDDVASSSKLLVSERGDGGDRLEPVPYDARVSPLEAEIDAFVRAALRGTRSAADFEEGADVVRIIEQAQVLGTASRAGQTAREPLRAQ